LAGTVVAAHNIAPANRSRAATLLALGHCRRLPRKRLRSVALFDRSDRADTHVRLQRYFHRAETMQH